MPRPLENEYAAFYRHYVSLTQGNEVMDILTIQLREMHQFLAMIPVEKADYAYAPGKWSIRVLLQHIIDAERVFTFRALWFARGSKSPLPGYDENEFAEASLSGLSDFESLKNALIQLRETTIQLFSCFNEQILQRSGIANESHITVNALGFIIAGHFIHHQNILRERYLS